MLNMYVSFVGMGLLILAICLIVLSRKKLKGLLAGIVAIIAYICLIVGSLIIIYIVLSWPTS